VRRLPDCLSSDRQLADPALHVPAAAERGGGWTVLLDEQANLQLSDVRSERYRNQFSPLPLADRDAAPAGQALWLHYRLAPGDQEQLLRVFAPDLSGLDLYALEGEQLLRQLHHGRRPAMPARPCVAATMYCPCPTAGNRWTSTCAWPQSTSCVRPSALNLRPRQPRINASCGRHAVRRPDHADHAQPDPLPLHRSSTTLILALYHGLMLLSGLILLNLSGPWWHVWHSAQTPAAYLTLVLAGLSGLYFTQHFFSPCNSPRLNRLLQGEMLIVGLSGLVLLFVDTLPLNLITYALMALGSVSMLLVSSYHWYKGYAPGRLFGLAMVVFNLGGLVLLPALLGLTAPRRPGCCASCWA
jgi:hypothetical protein